MPTNTHYIDGDNYQLRQVIFANTPKAIAQTKQIAQRFKGKSEYDTAKKIFYFLKNDITYRADTTHQKVKLPSALLRERVGDCKSYALFTGAILSNLNIGWKYVLVSYRNDPTPTHIYVVTDSGIIIDAVWGKFNSEKQPTHKFYHKPKDMRISTITGLNGPKSANKDSLLKKRINVYSLSPNGDRKFNNTVQPTSVKKSKDTIYIEAQRSKPIKLDLTKESYKRLLDGKRAKDRFGFEEYETTNKQMIRGIQGQGIGAPRAFIWYRDSKGKDVPNALAAKWRANQTLLAPARGIITLLFKANAGGMSTMIKDLCFKKEGSVTQYPIPKKVSDKINKQINDKRNALSVPSSDYAIQQILSTPISTDYVSNTSSTFDPNAAAKAEKSAYETYKGRYDAKFGKGAYDKYLQWSSFATKLVNDTKAKYAVKTTAKSKALWGKFSNIWFEKGGDPWSLLETVQEGAVKKPKSTSFNYLIRKGMEKGLQIKDVGLLLRSVKEIVGGEDFSLDSKDAYVIGKGTGIGAEPATTAATIASYTKPIMEILTALFGLYQMFKALYPDEEVTETTDTDTNGGATSAELDAKLADGWMLLEDAQAFNAPTPYAGELTIDGVTIVKPNTDWFKSKFGDGDGMFAGFGGLILPLLIGGGVLMALNTSKKIKK